MNANNLSIPAKHRAPRIFPALCGMALATALCLGAFPARAQNEMSSDAQTNGTSGASAALSVDDQKFMTNAALGGMLEVKLGELAVQKAINPDVRSFAQKMITDHTMINNDLKVVATEKRLSLPPMLDARHQKMYEKMATYFGTEFDHEYVSAMIKAHKADARLFEKETRTQDSDLKNFADKALPVIQEHLNMVQGMNKS